MKIAILGAGNMGGAIARGLAASNIIKAGDITVTARTQATLDHLTADVPDINTTLSNADACREAAIIMLCIKPWLVQPVLEEIFPVYHALQQQGRAPLIVSVAAGITFAEIARMLGEDEASAPQAAIARVIPNTAISIRQSPTLICFNSEVSEAQNRLICDIFDQLGQSIVIDEAHMAAGTAVTSCGIAYALQYIKAAIQGAIELGFYPGVAKQMIDQTVQGAVALLETNGTMPDTEIYKVCTPGGITIRGLNEMSKEGFDNAVIQGLRKAAGK